MSTQEGRLGLVHRVLAVTRGIKEYAILVTDRRSIFIEQPKSRSGFLLRTEIVSGESGNTNLKPKTLEDYAGSAVGSLELEQENIGILHDSVTKLIVGVGGLFPVYHFDLRYRQEERNQSIVFYAVPLRTYITEGDERAREVVLREYAQTVFRLYAQVLPSSVIDDAGLGEAA